MNIQRVTETNWSGYMLKYALKSEPSGELNLDVELAARLGLRDLSEQQLKLLSAAILSRPVSPCEAALFCLQIPIVPKSDTVVYVDSSPPNLRTRRFSKWASKPVVPPVDVYCGRPSTLHHLTFTQFFREYITRSSFVQSSDEFVGYDAFGSLVFRHSRLIRFTDFHPASQPEAYFYGILLNLCPFTDESDLISIENPDKSYFHECILRELIVSEADLENHLESYTARNLYSEERRQQLVNLMLQKYPITEMDDLTPLDDMPLSARLDFTQNNCNAWTAESLFDLGLSDDFADVDNVQLTESQNFTFQELRAATGARLISGAPSAGKTFLIRYMVKQWLLEGKKVLLCATTGAAACRLSRTATTAHSLFSIPLKGRYLSPLDTTGESFAKISMAGEIVVDEMSMLTAYMLDLIFYRLRQVCGSLAAALSKKLIVFVGDHAQLPAIRHHRLDADDPVCLQCHISRSIHWPLLQIHHLLGSKRHSDPQFLQFLNEIRFNAPTQTTIDEVLGQCFITEREAESLMTSDVLVLCSHRSDAQRFNEKVLKKMFPATDLIRVQRAFNAIGVEELSVWLNEPKFFEMDSIAVGARVMLTTNLDTRKFAANGSLGTIAGISSADGDLKTVFVKFDEGGATLGIRRTRFQARHFNGRRYFKSAFPLLLGYSITGHKSQGATIKSNVILYVCDAFAPGLLYVMLSRVTDRSKLKILTPLRPTDFQPVPNLVGLA